MEASEVTIGLAASLGAAAATVAASGLTGTHRHEVNVRYRLLLSAAVAMGGAVGYCFSHIARRRMSSGRRRTCLERELAAIDQLMSKLSTPDALEHNREIERWVLQLYGGAFATPPALRLAARSFGLRKENGNIAAALCKAGADDEATSERVSVLLARTSDSESYSESTHDLDVHIFQDAVGIAFFASCHKMESGNDTQLIDKFEVMWKKMTPSGRSVVVSLDYPLREFGCLLIAIAAAERLETSSLVVAPRLPPASIEIIRHLWGHVSRDTFGRKFLERILEEDPTLEDVVRSDLIRPTHIWKVMQLIIDHLDAEHVPWLERFAHGFAAVCQSFGKLRSVHLATLKRGIVRTALSYVPSNDKKVANRLFEAVFFTFASVAAPHLVMSDCLAELGISTSTALAMPGGGSHSAALAAHGVGLLIMCLSISLVHFGGHRGTPTMRRVHKLSEARGWFTQAVRESINAYCGNLASAYADLSDSRSTDAGLVRWHRRCVDVHLRVAEVCVGTAIECSSCHREIVPSLRCEWAAGVRMLRTAVEISLEFVDFYVLDRTMVHSDLELRLQRVKDMDSPWDELIGC
eukprot:TRINITY_DN18949_c0_g1_i1.p1 TRINITY_DN18949_c0_g1~~TRINITY_DN18949_c0_g1_i1.p1  ORF type:complete len:579 (-),score=57.31 TRINITY_DN18949_c0_g1_i1:87-1823(-)